MTVSEYERTQLFNWFEEHMGKERATAMMSLLPPVGWGDVATRRDLRELEEQLASIKAQMATKVDLAEGLREQQRTLVTWVLLAQAGVIAALGVLIGFLH